MTKETPGASPLPEVEDDDEDGVGARDENDPGEVASRFVTKGLGWSGRDSEDDD